MRDGWRCSRENGESERTREKSRPRGKRRVRGEEGERLGSAVGEDEVVASEAANEDSDVSVGMGEAVWVEERSICCSACWDFTITSLPLNPQTYTTFNKGRETEGRGSTLCVAAFKPAEY